ncbi:MAG TPA: hypothetical protein DEQ47_10830 [Solibacterales bacterium]|nr:hypothetical protein [Bryobacterales bacterium]
MQRIACDGDLDQLDAAVTGLPDVPAVFLLHPAQGRPYLARTTLLRRRLLRLLGERAAPSRLLNLRHAVRTIEYCLTGSSLEAALRLYELARVHFPDDYLETLRLRLPTYLKLTLNNPFPRTMVTTHTTGARSLCLGPFRSRVSAERFEAAFLDLFQVRRCLEDLHPAPDHPGCMYGEMGLCARPCQQAVSADEYAGEVRRAAEFLSTGGRSLLHTIQTARDSSSQQMDFEEAARQHRRLEKVEQVLKLRDELARDIDHLHAITITRSAAAGAVELGFLRAGHWQGFQTLPLEATDGKPVSLDRRLRQHIDAAAARIAPPRERQESLALLSRWVYSSWRDGEMILFDSYEQVPVRRLVHAVHNQSS